MNKKIFLLTIFLILLISTSLKASSIFEDIEANRIEKVMQDILKNPELINSKSSYNMTPLHYAVQYESREKFAEFLISMGADLNSKDKDGRTPLLIAINNCNWDMIKLLLSSGADVNVVNNIGQGTLHYGARIGAIDLCKDLLSKGLDINLRDKNGRTPLYYAVQMNNKKTAFFLISKGADVKTKDIYEQNLLHIVNNSELAELFLLKKVDINARDNKGNTPLHYAGFYKNNNIAEMLVYYGANGNIKNYNGELPLYQPSKGDYHKEIFFPDMVFIKGGTFNMGSSQKTSLKVQVSSFYIGKYEVKNKEYWSYDPDHRARAEDPSSENFPAGGVSWFDAVKYCNWLSLQKGLQVCYVIHGSDVKIDISRNGYRLPTEAEWEYACRGGTKTSYYWGNNLNGDYCWSRENSGLNVQPVGQKKPNKFGLYDMAGSVYEWCNDVYGSYQQGFLKDPIIIQPGNYRVCRGGNYLNSGDFCKSYYRHNMDPNEKEQGTGFRIVKSSL